MALPSLVRLMKTESRITRTTVEMTTATSFTPMSISGAAVEPELRPKWPAGLVKRDATVSGSRLGKRRLTGPRQRYIAPSRMKGMPMAVIRGASRGALRSGR